MSEGCPRSDGLNATGILNFQGVVGMIGNGQVDISHLIPEDREELLKWKYMLL